MANIPIQTYSIGRVKASLWKNEGTDTSTYYSVDVHKSYKDKETDEWKTSTSYTHDELLNLAKVVERAEMYVAQQIAQSA